MKKSIVFMSVMTVALLFLPHVKSAAAEWIPVYLDCQQVSFDEQPFEQNNRIFVGIGAVFRAFGSEPAWNGDLQKVTAFHGKTALEYVIGSTTYWVGGVAHESDAAPMIAGQRVFVPLRLIADSYNADVYWNGDSRSVFIYSEEFKPNTNNINETEPNNSKNKANSMWLDENMLPAFQTEGDIDYFRLWVHKPGTFDITAKSGNARQIPVFSVFNDYSDIAIATSKANSQEIQSATLTLEPGIYYIKATNDGDSYSSEYYTLRASTVK